MLRKVTQFTFHDGRPNRPTTWLKLIFEVHVENLNVILDPVEHQRYLWVAEHEVKDDFVGSHTKLEYISPANKDVKLEAFRLRKEALPS